MNSFKTLIGEGREIVDVDYDLDCDGVLFIASVKHNGHEVRGLLHFEQIETLICEADKKYQQARRDDFEIPYDWREAA